VEFTRPLIIRVLLEELKLHRVALSIIDRALSDDVIDLDISLVACRLFTLEEVRQAELWQLSDHW
jgi:hypothetical protein